MLTLTFKTTFHKQDHVKSLLNQAALSSFYTSHCTAGNPLRRLPSNVNSTCEALNPASRSVPHQAADLCATIHVGDVFPVALWSLTWQGHGALLLSQALPFFFLKKKKKNLNEEQPGAISIVLGSY